MGAQRLAARQPRTPALVNLCIESRTNQLIFILCFNFSSRRAPISSGPADVPRQPCVLREHRWRGRHLSGENWTWSFGRRENSFGAFPSLEALDGLWLDPLHAAATASLQGALWSVCHHRQLDATLLERLYWFTTKQSLDFLNFYQFDTTWTVLNIRSFFSSHSTNTILRCFSTFSMSSSMNLLFCLNFMHTPEHRIVLLSLWREKAT